MHNMICVTGVYSREITVMLLFFLFFFVSNFNIGIY